MLKKNMKLIIGLMIGIIVSSAGVYAASSLNAENIKISKSNMSKIPQENLQSALDYLYDKANTTNMITIESGVLHETQTYLGIAYLDPTDLSKKCSEADEKANRNQDGTITGVKTGCMKWYIYKDLGNSYKMILDHNTTAIQGWNGKTDDTHLYGTNVAFGPNTTGDTTYDNNVYKEVKLLSTAVAEGGSGWVVEPDLISAEEIASIIGQVDFDSSTTNWVYFDSKDTIHPTIVQGTSKYAWVYDNLGWDGDSCTKYGCNYTDTLNSAAYWTKTTYGEAGSGSAVWGVFRHGRTYLLGAYITGAGVRPVIQVEKSLFN